MYKKGKFFNKYYTKDGGISYYSCDGEGEQHIQNCIKCNYNENNFIKLECTECKNEFTILDDELNKCYSKKDLNNKKYFNLNNTHMKTCSKIIDNCSECENETKCIKCEKNYYLINNETKICVDINQIIPIDEFYLDNNNSTYYSCNNSYYNSIDNCKKCETKNTCSLCNDGFTFINSNKMKCIEKKTLENKYYQDPNDNSNYESCSKIDSNCVTCSSYNTCLTCSENFG